jgi:hypothetical protein
MRARHLAPAALLLCVAASVGHAQPQKGPTPIKPGQEPPVQLQPPPGGFGTKPTPTLPATPPPHLVQPGPPPVLTVTNTPPIYEYQKILLNMRIDHFPFDNLDLNRLPNVMHAFVRIPGITYGGPNPQRDKNGSIAFSVIGYFMSGANGEVRILLTSPQKGDSRTVNVSTTVPRAARATVTVTNTWSLKDRLAPQLLASGVGSFCNGQPPIGSALGILEHNGKLSFFGRSGPIGTACVFGLKEMPVANGIIGASWKVVKEGPGEQCRPYADFLYNGMRGAVSVDENGFIGNPVLFSDSLQVSDSGVLYATDNTFPVTVLKPTEIRYTCPVTLGTDVRTIRIILDKVTMLGPPGQRFP